MDKVLKLDLPKINSYVYYIATDWHDKHYCIQTAKELTNMALETPKSRRILILGGDFLDLPEFMPKNKDFKRHLSHTHGIEEHFLPAFEEGLAWGNIMLDELQKVFENIYFVCGNHDYRAEIFQKQFCPAEYKPHFSIQAGLNLQKRGIEFINYNHWLDLSPGSLTFTHGMYHGNTHAKKHFETAGASVAYGHVHQAQMKSFTRRGETQYAYAIPCMCNLAPDYLKNRENNWDKGFGVAIVRSDGHHHMQIHVVKDGELVGIKGK